MTPIRSITSALSLCLMTAVSVAQQSDPPALYLTWIGDPMTTMTVVWHTTAPVQGPKVFVKGGHFKEVFTANATSRPFPHSNYHIHYAQIEELKPDTKYSFRIAGYENSHIFRTMPTTCTPQRPVVFVNGGDTYRSATMFETMLTTAASRNPDFISFGGDIAYVNGNPTMANVWHDWFAAYKRCAKTLDGRLIPMLNAIGNHEVQLGYNQPISAATYFYDIFPHMQHRGYQVFDLCNDLSMVILDSSHTTPVSGAQTTWLQQTLEARFNRPHLFVTYHVSAWPSHRQFSDPVSTQVRQHWVPLFDQFGVDTVFENHDHVYKRTPRLKNGVVDPTGVLYIGDGCFGATPRTPLSATTTWYLERTDSKAHFILTTVTGSSAKHEALDSANRVFDTFPPAQQSESTEDLHFVMNKTATELLRAEKIPGLSIALVRDGDVVAARGFGEAEAGARRRTGSLTTYPVKELAEPMAFMGVIELANQGFIKLDDPAGRYLRNWRLEGGGGRAAAGGPVTLRRVMQHSKSPKPSLAPGLRMVAATAQSGRQNSGGPANAFQIAKGVLEDITEIPVDDYLTQRILTPLSLTESSLERDEVVDRRLATPHAVGGAPIKRPAPTHSVFVTAKDAARFLASMMRGPKGEAPGRGVVTPEDAALILRPFSTTAPASQKKPNDTTDGFTHLHLFHPDLRIGVVILVNGEAKPESIKKAAETILRSLAR